LASTIFKVCIWLIMEKTTIHPSWNLSFDKALTKLTPEFQDYLQQGNYLPGWKPLFAAFSIPQHQVQVVLIGESPYPRQESANGYAFWDAAVGALWSDKGLSKPVNRATSLRNIMKMLLHAQGLLNPPFSPEDIAKIDKNGMPSTLDELFSHMIKTGFLLLNASLSWSDDKPVSWHAKNWYPFIHCILEDLLLQQPHLQILLFGKIAEKFKDLPRQNCIVAEHPYVLSFIENPKVLSFFQDFNLLRVTHVESIS
jgi:uracil-DNA glycosylase